MVVRELVVIEEARRKISDILITHVSSDDSIAC